MISLIVVRHGETDWNRVRRLQGHTDVALNERGVEQAVRLASALAGEPIAAVHSSDLGRAMATALPVATALGLEAQTHVGLRERNYGVLEGKTFEEILEQHPDEAAMIVARDAKYRCRNGESQEEFFARVVDTVERIARAEDALSEELPRRVLVVTHGGVLDMLYRAAFGIALDAQRVCPTPNAAINRIAFEDGRFVVREWATIPGDDQDDGSSTGAVRAGSSGSTNTDA